MKRWSKKLVVILTAIVAIVFVVQPSSAASRVSAPSVASADSEAVALAWHEAVALYVYQHPDTFTGLVGDPAGTDGLIVTMPKLLQTPSTASAIEDVAYQALLKLFPADLIAQTPLPSLTIGDADQTKSALRRAQAVVAEAMSARSDWVDSVVRVSIVEATGTLFVGYTKVPTEDDASQLSVRLGVKVSVGQVQPSEQTGKLNDTAPFYGGGRLTTPTGGGCTGAFSVQKAGTFYMLTAGHCGSGVFKNGNQSATLGSTAARVYVNNGYDTQIIKASTAGRVFVDCYNCGGSQPIKGAYTLAPGPVPICLGGSYSNEQCSVQVVSTENCQMFGTMTTCHLAEVSAASTQTIISQGGDSGGPVYRRVTASLYAAGTIIGCVGYNCSHTGSSAAWVLPIADSLGAFSVTLTIG